VLFLDVSTGLIFEDRLNEDDLWESTTRFGVGYFSSTHNQRLSFETGVSARVRDNDAGLIDPFVLIDYAHFSRNTEIGADLSYRSSEVDGGNLAADFDTEDLADQTGRREDMVRPAPRDRPRLALRHRYAAALFPGDPSPTAPRMTIPKPIPRQSTLRFTIDPRIVLTLTGAWTQKETDDLVNTVDTTTRVTFGADLAIDRVWSASAALGYAEIETETTGGTTSVDGLEGSFILTRDLRNGSLVFSTDHVLTDDGWRNSVRVRRGFEMANGDAFDASLGQIFFEEGGSGHLASLNFNRTVRGGALSFGFDYSTDLDDTNMLVQRTRFDAALRQD
jgi:hypothetical protein